MKKMTKGSLAIMVALVSAGSLLAHHSLAKYDITKAVRVKGTIVQFHPINPHSSYFWTKRAPMDRPIVGQSKVPRFFNSNEPVSQRMF